MRLNPPFETVQLLGGAGGRTLSLRMLARSAGQNERRSVPKLKVSPLNQQTHADALEPGSATAEILAPYARLVG